MDYSNQLLIILQLISFFVPSAHQSLQLFSKPIRTNNFLQSFVHCQFRLSLGNDQEIEKDNEALAPLVQFYAGAATFTFFTREGINSLVLSRSRTKNRRSGNSRRFHKCDVHLYLSKNLEFVDETEDINERPEFVWILFLNFSVNEENKQRGAGRNEQIASYVNLVNLAYPAIYFAIFGFNEAKLFCFSCDDNDRLVDLSSTSYFNYKDLHNYYNSVWKNSQRSLHGTLIKINYLFTPYRSPLKFHCNIHKRYFEDEIYCTYFILSNVLNISLINNQDERLREVVTHGSLYTGMIVSNTNSYWMSYGRYEMLYAGFSQEAYTYFMVLDEAPNNLQAIIQPFDISTWILLFLSLFSVATLLTQYYLKCSKNTRVPGSIITSFRKFFLSALTFLLDQPVTFFTFNTIWIKESIFIIILWSSWSFLSVSLSQAYKGTLFSFLASTPSPWIPGNLKSLLLSGMQLLTWSTVETRTSSNDGLMSLKTANSTLKFMLGDVIKLNEKNDSIYRTFQKRLEWISGTSDAVVLNIMQNHSNYNSYLNSTVKIKRAFIFIDVEAQTEFLSMQLKFFTKKWISQLQALPMFMSRSAWTLKENYLAQRLKNVMAQVYESGLYSRWDTFYKKFVMIYYIRLAAMKLNGDYDDTEFVSPLAYEKNVESKLGKGLSLQTLFEYIYMNEKKEPPISDSLPEKVYTTVVWYAILSLGSASLLFLVELGVKCLTNCKSRSRVSNSR